ncbi:MAG: DUF4434 domain-containing protein [Kiritimatiellales bacterium]
MYDIIDVEDFKIFMASQRAQDSCGVRNREANQDNLQFLQTLGSQPQRMNITGAFIYAHAPNYFGRPALHWGVAEWRAMFRQFKLLGIDTAIFQAAIWNELRECYYPSQKFSAYKTWNVVEPMLEAAGAENIRMFLGGYGSTTGLSDQVAPEIMEREEQACVNCLTELMKYRQEFHGFYFSSETAYTGSYDRNKISRLNRIYRGFFEHIKSVDAGLQIMMSPGTKYFPGKEQEMQASWLETLDGVPLDILAPQDSIGTCGSRLRHAEAMYKAWADVCRERKITFWSNIEVFQRGENVMQLNHSITADPDRVTAQINAAAPYAKKLICWEAPYYVCDPNNPRAAALARVVFGQKDTSLANENQKPELAAVCG